MVRYLILAAVLLLSLGSCILPEAHVANLLGNYEYSRGEYQMSMVHYLEARDLSEDDAAFVAFNLANVYYSLGELEAANDQWEKALLSRDQGLLFMAHFNQGLAFYDLGRYEAAFESFRQSLAILPSNVDAKRNLELAWAKIQANREGERSPARAAAASGGSDGGEFDRIFDYMKRKEVRLWDWTQEFSGNHDGQDW